MHEQPTNLADQPQLAVVGPGGRLPLDRRTLETLAELFVSLLDIAEPDTDIEETDAEDELLSARALAIEEDRPGCIASDPGEHSLHERHGKQPPFKSSPICEDREEDDGSDSSGDDGEPNFNDPWSRCGYGPGCVISDSDYGDEEAGEPEQA